MVKSNLVVAAVLVGTASAFNSPISPAAPRLSSTSISATSDDRRQVLGTIFGTVLGGVAAVNTVGNQFAQDEDAVLLAGLTNPAGQAWRGKFKGQQFTPGKGLRAHDELVAGLTNPAGQAWRGKFKGQQFTP
eukprot:CAMPEP_0194302388 /NCGR_PEP_ID=MMETSP0171-20130528/104_1 /TAXON_ID=218684 /ORGANISM="Corethron pennatum, Strain L29A3" /LENGTH=131 /DNA_ID=CAMNT_0039052741 /DNA_START=32 /DNA_END=423 /DNA_ORIENTATION=-